MLSVKCPTKLLGVPHLRQLTRVASLSKLKCDINVLSNSESSTIAIASASSRFAAVDECFSVSVAEPSAALPANFGAPQPLPLSAVEASRWLLLTAAPPGGTVVAPWRVATVFSQWAVLSRAMDGVFEALLGESGHHLAARHADLAFAVGRLDAEMRTDAANWAAGSPQDAVLSPLLDYLVGDCGMPVAAYPSLVEWRQRCAGAGSFAAEDERIQRYLLEFHGAKAEVVAAAAGETFVAANSDASSLYARAAQAEETLFCTIHRLLRARGNDPTAPRPPGTPTGTARVIDAARGRARVNSAFGAQGSLGTTHVPWNTPP